MILENFMSPEGKIRVISMNSHSPEDTDSYVKGRGCGNLGTGLRFIRTPYLEHGDLKFYACSAKSERRPKYCQQYNKREPIPFSCFEQKGHTELQIPEKV